MLGLQVPASLALEPAGLATEKAVEMAAGAVIPETRITVLNGSSHCMTKAILAGERHALNVTQCLWRLAADAGGSQANALTPSCLPGQGPPSCIALPLVAGVSCTISLTMHHAVLCVCTRTPCTGRLRSMVPEHAEQDPTVAEAAI